MPALLKVTENRDFEFCYHRERVLMESKGKRKENRFYLFFRNARPCDMILTLQFVEVTPWPRHPTGGKPLGSKQTADRLRDGFDCDLGLENEEVGVQIQCERGESMRRALATKFSFSCLGSNLGPMQSFGLIRGSKLFFVLCFTQAPRLLFAAEWNSAAPSREACTMYARATCVCQRKPCCLL